MPGHEAQEGTILNVMTGHEAQGGTLHLAVTPAELLNIHTYKHLPELLIRVTTF